MMKRRLMVAIPVVVIAIISTIMGLEFFNDELPEGQGASNVSLELTYPLGASPKVFSTGWAFGAKCIMNLGTPQEKDISDEVQWSGSGSFQPRTGSVSHPTFNSDGSNTIVLSIELGGRTISQNFAISTVSPANYARVGDYAECAADVHGCPACPHYVAGKILIGSSTVMIGGLPAARIGDGGSHQTYICCGPSNEFVITAGDPQVIIDGKPAARLGDSTQHCGGTGKVVRQLSGSTGAGRLGIQQDFNQVIPVEADVSLIVSGKWSLTTNCGGGSSGCRGPRIDAVDRNASGGLNGWLLEVDKGEHANLTVDVTGVLSKSVAVRTNIDGTFSTANFHSPQLLGFDAGFILKAEGSGIVTSQTDNSLGVDFSLLRGETIELNVVYRILCDYETKDSQGNLVSESKDMLLSDVYAFWLYVE